MKIRVLNEEDAGLFRDLCLEAVDETPSAFCESAAEVLAKSIETFTDHLASHGRGDFVLGAFDEANHLIGTVGLYRAPYGKQSHKGTLWGLYVTPHHRQRGIGRALTVAVLEHACNLPGILQINLSVANSNPSAQQLYESLGFKTYGIEPDALNVNGVYTNEIWMQLSLIDHGHKLQTP
jgi:ribosomal protein S18 acetylase RimI-like enzyme